MFLNNVFLITRVGGHLKIKFLIIIQQLLWEIQPIHAINSYAILVSVRNVAVMTRMRVNKAMYEKYED